MKSAAVFLILLCAAFTAPEMNLSSDSDVSNDPRGSSGTCGSSRAYFILPEGRAYSGIGFFTAGAGGERAGGASLRFADEVSLFEESRHGSLSWFRCARDGMSFYLPGSHITAESRGVAYGSDGNLPVGREIVDLARPLSIRYEPNDLEVVPSKYGADGYEDRVLLLRREAKEKFIALIEEAEREGIIIRILSAYRSARYQSGLYGNAISKRGVFQNSVAKPGHSEHQLGTTCDLTTDEIQNGLSSEFEGTKAFRWIKENGHRYGIFLSYSKYGVRVTGYIYEPWHFRYYGDARWTVPGEEGRIFFTR